MAPFAVSEVVLIDYPFSDGSGSKKRPALLVGLLENGDILLCMITSRANADESAIPIAGTELDYSGLGKASFIRPQRLFVADPTLVTRKTGAVSHGLIKRVKEYLSGWMLEH